MKQSLYGLGIGESVAEPSTVVDEAAGQTDETEVDDAVVIGPKPGGVFIGLAESRVKRGQMLVEVPLFAVMVPVLDVLHVIGVGDDDFPAVGCDVGIVAFIPNAKWVLGNDLSPPELVEIDRPITDP